MCDIGSLEAVLGSAAAAITAALVLIAIATALNGGFFSAPGAPAPMAAAGVSTLVAVGLLIGAREMLSDYYACHGSPDACLGHFNNLMNALTGLITILSIQGAATLALATVAWIPWAVLPLQIAIVAALVTQIAMIPTVIAFWAVLKDCIDDAAVVPAMGPLIVALPFVGLIFTGVIYTINRKNKGTTTNSQGGGKLRG